VILLLGGLNNKGDGLAGVDDLFAYSLLKRYK
jgi:hypothetical protein